MAFTEKYVTVAGAGSHDGSAEAHAWTFAEMIAAAPAAETRVNIKAGSYSEGVTTLPSNGTVSAPIVLRGYSSSIGDLDNQGRGSDGTLTTTNFPDFTLTGIWTPSAFCVLQNLDITGALSSTLVGSSSADRWGIVNCRVVNTQNNSSANCITFDDYCVAVNCDFSCTGAAHSNLLNGDAVTKLIGCRFVGTSTSATFVTVQQGIVIGCVFIGAAGTTKGLVIEIGRYYDSQIADCTFYNLGTAIELTYSGSPLELIPIVGCHITDCAKAVDNTYSATQAIATIEMFNRLRDNTTPLTGVLSAVVAGALSTNTATGDTSTDYVDTSSLRLKSTAPGKGVGMMPYRDIGAYQCAYPTLPTAAQTVYTGVASYGYADALYDGTYYGPNLDSAPGVVDATAVISTAHFGVANATQGTAAGGGVIQPGMSGGFSG